MTLSCTPIVTNNTIANNHSTSSSTTASGAGICAYSGSSCTGKNNIVHTNYATNNPDFTGNLSFTYSLAGQYLSGIGNMVNNPQYVHNIPESYFNLCQTASGQATNSPCVDTGDPASLLIEGSTRTDFIFDTGVVDMGFHWFEPLSGFADLDIWFTEEELSELTAALIPTEMVITISNYPNPFNVNTTINLKINRPEEMELVVTDVSGRIVDTIYQGYIQSGIHQFHFSGENLSSGVYFFRANVGGYNVTGKALLIK